MKLTKYLLTAALSAIFAFSAVPLDAASSFSRPSSSSSSSRPSSSPSKSTFSSPSKSSSGWGSSTTSKPSSGSSGSSFSSPGSSSFFKKSTTTSGGASSADKALTTKTAGGVSKSRADIVSDFTSDKANVEKYKNKFDAEPPSRPSYIPPTYASEGHTYNVIYNSGMGGYGYYNALGTFILYDALSNAAYGHANTYVYSSGGGGGYIFFVVFLFIVGFGILGWCFFGRRGY